MYCLYCGKLNDDTNDCCIECGKSLNKIMDRKELISKSLNGDEEAFNLLIKSVQPMAIFYARSIARDEFLAQEAVQNANIKMHRSLSSLNDVNSFEGWFKRIVRNETIDLINKQNKEMPFSSFNDGVDNDFEYSIEDEKIDYQPELKFAQREKEELIKEIVYSLSENQRSAIMMYFFEDMKIKEIADSLNIPESTIKTRLSAGKSAIKKKVEEIQKRYDIKLYGATPLGFFLWLLKGYSEGLSIVGVSATALVGTGVTNTVLGNLASNFIKSVVGKIIIGATAVSLATAGAYTVTNMIKQDNVEEKVVEVKDDKKEEEIVEEKVITHKATYSFRGKDGISLPSEVMSKLPASIWNIEPGTVITNNSFESVKTGDYIYNFDGWDKNEYTITDSDVSFIGTWSRKEIIVSRYVNYVFISSGGETMPDSIYDLLPASSLINKGVTVSPPYIDKNSVSGWTFKGWDQTSVTVGDQDVTITGTWKKKNEGNTANTGDNEDNTGNEDIETINYIIYLYAVDLGGVSHAGSDILPKEILDLFPKSLTHRVIPYEDRFNRTEYPVEVGTIISGWRFDGAEGGMGDKETGDISEWWVWREIE